MTIIRLFLLGFVFLMGNFTYSQSYVTAMGLRLGDELGVTLQQRILPRTTIEGILSSSAVKQQGRVTLLAELHQPLISRRFNFYLGAGMTRSWSTAVESSQKPEQGVAAIAGGEMTLGRINIAWDFQPVYQLGVQERPFSTSTAVSMRYVLVKKLRSSKEGGIFKKDKRKQKLKDRRRKQRSKEKARKQKKRKKQHGDQQRGWRIFQKSGH